LLVIRWSDAVLLYLKIALPTNLQNDKVSQTSA